MSNSAVEDCVDYPWHTGPQGISTGRNCTVVCGVVGSDLSRQASYHQANRLLRSTRKVPGRTDLTSELFDSLRHGL
eukprot:6465429-Amphidinium_carterae.1